MVEVSDRRVQKTKGARGTGVKCPIEGFKRPKREGYRREVSDRGVQKTKEGRIQERSVR